MPARISNGMLVSSLLGGNVVGQTLSHDKSVVTLTVLARSDTLARTIAKNYARLTFKVGMIDIESVDKQSELNSLNSYNIELKP